MLLASRNRARQLFRNGTSDLSLSLSFEGSRVSTRSSAWFRSTLARGRNPGFSRYSPSVLLQSGWFRSCERTIRSPPTNDGIVFHESVGFARAREPAAAVASLPLAFATLPYLSLSWSIERTSASKEEPEAAQRRPRVRTNECRVASERRRKRERTRERDRNVEKRAGSRRWEKEEVREMDKDTGEREKDGTDVKQGSLAAYSIARETCRFCGSPPPHCHLIPFSLFLSLSLYTFHVLSTVSLSLCSVPTRPPATLPLSPHRIQFLSLALRLAYLRS